MLLICQKIKILYDVKDGKLQSERLVVKELWRTVAGIHYPTKERFSQPYAGGVTFAKENNQKITIEIDHQDYAGMTLELDLDDGRPALKTTFSSKDVNEVGNLLLHTLHRDESASGIAVLSAA